ncbi:MAG: hypothetical protein RBS39_01195 [Phycisphaerales bacterium]|nr:hypothetical protein [Phycisphaerales bacterium]
MRHGSSDATPRGEITPSLLVVAGASLRAESEDRVIAQAVRDAANSRLSDRSQRPDALVCSDVWYLSHDVLHELPTISVGPPENNALTARLADSLPAAFAIDGRMLVQFDARGGDPRACVWGDTPHGTASAADVFVERFLDQFLGFLA